MGECPYQRDCNSINFTSYLISHECLWYHGAIVILQVQMMEKYEKSYQDQKPIDQFNRANGELINAVRQFLASLDDSDYDFKVDDLGVGDVLRTSRQVDEIVNEVQETARRFEELGFPMDDGYYE